MYICSILYVMTLSQATRGSDAPRYLIQGRKGAALTAVTNSALLTFFANGVTVLGTRVHPPNEEVSSDHLTDNTSSAWAQIWTASEAEVERCMELKDDLARKGM